jgi:phthalate 4,5-cis-dihydrodiol dehydrogenase
MRFGAEGTAPKRVGSAAGSLRQPWFGVTVASFEHGDMRQSPNGLYLYTDEGRQEVLFERGQNHGLVEMKELYEAVVEGKPLVHDGRWAMATLEVGNAMVQSSSERREILLNRQVSLPV